MKLTFLTEATMHSASYASLALKIYLLSDFGKVQIEPLKLAVFLMRFYFWLIFFEISMQNL
jgi:hypothetical protein